MITVEEFNKEYLDECARIYAESFSAAPWNDPWDDDRARKRLSDIICSPGFYGIVALENNLIRGAIFGNIEVYCNGLMYNLREMFVENSSRGRGIGSDLISALENKLSGKNVSSIYLMTAKGPMTESFYKKNRFKRIKKMIVMSKPL
jgi:GNAT superfamily N-acetyltransferase